MELQNNCWLWAGNCKPDGYGRLWDTAINRYVYAHRLIYEALVGPIPDSLQLDHLCRVPQCINPEHLEPVTQRTNILRGNAPPARHARKKHCKYGHPLSGDNLVISYRGHRQCKACVLDYNQRYYVKNREKIMARSQENHRKSKLKKVEV
jgi:hypothetical protein